MRGEARQQRVIDCFDRRVTQLNGTLNEEKGTAQVSETDVAPAHMLPHFRLDLLIEDEQLSLLTFLQTTDIMVAKALGVPVDDVPEVSFVIKLADIDLSQFASKR